MTDRNEAFLAADRTSFKRHVEEWRAANAAYVLARDLNAFNYPIKGGKAAHRDDLAAD